MGGVLGKKGQSSWPDHRSTRDGSFKSSHPSRKGLPDFDRGWHAAQSRQAANECAVLARQCLEMRPTFLAGTPHARSGRPSDEPLTKEENW